MTAPGTYSAGTAYLDVIPSFKGVQVAIARELRKMESALGKEAGKEFGKEFEGEAKKFIDKALDTTKNKAAKSGKEAGDEYAGKFADGFSKTMERVQREFKTIKLDYKFDDETLQKKFRSLKGDIERMSKFTIGANMDAGPAFREMAKVELKLRELQDATGSLEMRSNLGALADEYERFRRQIERTARFEVEADIDVERTIGKFEREARTRIKAALANFPPIEFDADVTPAERRIQELRQELIGIHDVVITGDFDGQGVIEEIERVRRELATIATNEAINLKVRSDAEGAASELLKIRALAEAVDNTKVEIKVDIDRGFQARVKALRDQMTGAGSAGQAGANAFRAFNGVILAATTILPAVIPVIGALAGGLALLGPLALGAAAGLTVGILAFGGIGDAVKALNEVDNNRAKDAQANAKKVSAANRGVEDAQRSLDRAVTDGARSVKDARDAVTEATEDGARAVRDAQENVTRAEEEGARQIQAANRDVSEARTAAARTAQDGARSVAQAVETQQDAEEALVRAQGDVIRAQEDVTRAREAAQEQAEDLALSIRGGALAERDAVLDLAEAQRAYDEGKDDQSKTIEERERLLLSLEKEKLNLDRIRETNGDLAIEQAEWARNGVEGSDQVVAAQDRVVSARQGVASAEESLRDAVAGVSTAITEQRENNERAQQAIGDAVRRQGEVQAEVARSISDAVAARERTEVDAAKSVADAQQRRADVEASTAQSIGDAQRNLTEAQGAYRDAIFETGELGSASMQKLNEAMGALGPAGQAFAQYLQSIRGEMRELRDLAQAGVLPGVQDAIDTILTKNGPGLKQFISDMGFVVGDLFRKTGELFTNPQWQGIFDVWGKSAPIFMEQFGDIGLALLTFFGELFRGLAPYAIQFGDSLVDLAENSAAWMATFVDSQTFRDIMEWLFTEGPKVWDTLLNVGEAIGAILIALAPLGAVVLDLINLVAEIIADMDPTVLGIVLTAIIGMIASFQVATGLFTVAMLAVDAALLPFLGWILVIGAIITAIVILYTQSETFRNIVDGAFRAVGAVASWLFDNILKPAFEYTIWAWGLVVDAISGGVDKISFFFSNFGEIMGKALDIFMGLPGQIGYWLGFAVGKIVEFGITAGAEMIGWLADAAVAMGEWFMNLPGMLWDFFKIGGGLDQLVQDMFSGFWDFVRPGGTLDTWFGDFFGGLVSNIMGFFTGENALDRLGMNIINGLLDGLIWAWNGLWGWITSAWAGFIQGFKDAFGINSPSRVFFELGMWLIQGLLDGIASLVGLVVDGFIWLRDRAVQLMTEWAAWIVERFLFLRDDASRIAREMRDAVVNFFVNLRDDAVNAVQNARDWITERFSALRTNVIREVSELLGSALGLFFNLRDGVVSLATETKDWAAERFRDMAGAVTGIFSGLVEGVRNIWDGLKAVAADPINFVIGTVLNDGLLKAYNTVIDTLKLPGDWRINPLPLINQPARAANASTGFGLRRAAGGPVPGWSPNDVADNIPARLTAGEHVMPVKRVRDYGMDFLEALRHGRINPRQARSLMAPNAYAEGGPVYQQLFSAVKKRHPRAKLNSGLRPSNDLHGQGLAIDLGEEGFVGGAGRPYLAQMNRDLFDRAGKFIHELIYTGLGDDRSDLKAGNPLNYGAATNAGHRNHVHLGVRDIVGFLKAYGAGDGGGIVGSAMDAASNLLGNTWDSVTSVLGSVKDSIAAPLRDLVGRFGDSPLTKLAGGVVGTLPDRLWEKISGSVGTKAAEIWAGATNAADWAKNTVNSTISAGMNAGSWAIDKITGGSVQDKVRSAAAQRGWDKGAQWDALGWIIDHESGWNPNAQNPTSTAYGLFQFLNGTWGGTGISKTSDPARQAMAGMNYIGNRYKDPVGAKRFWEANRWYSEGGPVAPAANTKAEAPTLYDSGGWLPPGLTTVLNATNRPEPVLTGAAWDELVGGRGPAVEGGSVIGALHLHEVGSPSEAVEEVNHWAKVYDKGGRYVGARGSN